MALNVRFFDWFSNEATDTDSEDDDGKTLSSPAIQQRAAEDGPQLAPEQRVFVRVDDGAKAFRATSSTGPDERALSGVNAPVEVVLDV